MNICGVELTGNDAVICLIIKNNQQFTLPHCRVRKLTLPKDHTREDLQKFQHAFMQLMSDYSVDKVAIKARLTKGKFAGGAVSFKLEAAIQLLSSIQVEVLTATTASSSSVVTPSWPPGCSPGYVVATRYP